MRSLFLKIFLWFGVAMLVVNIASFVTGVFTVHRAQAESPMAQTLAVFAQSAVEIFERDGTTATTAYLDRVERASRIHALLLDRQGNSLSGGIVSDGLRAAAGRATEAAPFAFDFAGQSHPIAARLVHGATGTSYVLAGELPKPGFPGGPPRFGQAGSFAFVLQMLARTFLPLLLIGSLFCYLLARYLSTPVVQLRNATQQLSAGHLTARVDQTLLRRRDEIGYLGHDFNLMAGRLEATIEAQRRLLGDISHELRSPLARQGVALGLARRLAGPSATSALDRIERENKRLNELIGQLLALSQLEADAKGLDKTEIDLSALLQEVVDDADFEANVRERAVTLVKSEAVAVFGVVELIRRSIENVVRNAVRHTRPGTQVDVSLTTGAVDGRRCAVVKVRDYGNGVPENSIKDIFRPFYRVETDRDRKIGGVGLGLSIAARAVRLHQGAIETANAADGGLIVEIRLPLA